LFHDLLPLLTLLFSFELTASFVSNIAQLMKDTALIQNARAIDLSQRISQSSTSIAHNHLESLLGLHPTVPQSI
jgi:hypothetical protein